MELTVTNLISLYLTLSVISILIIELNIKLTRKYSFLESIMYITNTSNEEITKKT